MKVITVKDAVYDKLVALAESQGITANQFLEKSLAAQPVGLSQLPKWDSPSFVNTSKSVFLGEASLTHPKKVQWWARPDLNRGPSPCEGDFRPRIVVS